ncbi:MAG TPA: GWxTD domain-containing protein [Thermoanaerobaculia bacterium]|nr:GWxTD domain-containing protein [Thermoanaerobaculia bacterium]
MKIIRLSATALFLFGMASTSFAALSKNYADFAKGPYQHLLTSDERKQWASVRTDEQAQQFIDLFWARRDPTPTTPANEFRTAAEERAKVADGRFGAGRTAGSATDRGKVFILLGSPTKIRRASNEPQGTIQTPQMGAGTGTNQGYSPKEIWEYDQAKSPLPLGQPLAEIAFIDQYGSNDWKIDRVPRTDPGRVFEQVSRSYVTQPGLTELPTYATAAAAPAPVAAAPVAVAAPVVPAVTGLTSEELRAAVTAASAAPASDSLFLTTGEFITPTGEHFVPVQLWAPKSAGLTGGSEVTFFGTVTNEQGGTEVVSFEEPVKLAATNDDAYYARSLTLAPGRYRGTFGFARDGKPVSVVTRPIVVQGLDKAAPGVSRLLLSTDVHPLTEAQRATDPFAFGGLKVVPRGNSTFRKSEELWYFVEMRNPGTDLSTNLPKLTMAVSIIGKSDAGKNVKMLGAASEVPAQPLNGVPGHYAVGQAMPLSTFKPGNYTISLKLTDVALNKTYEVSEAFRIVD